MNRPPPASFESLPPTTAPSRPETGTSFSTRKPCGFHQATPGVPKRFLFGTTQSPQPKTHWPATKRTAGKHKIPRVSLPITRAAPMGATLKHQAIGKFQVFVDDMP